MKYRDKRYLTEHLKREIVHRKYTLGHMPLRISRELYVNPSTINTFCQRYVARGCTLNHVVERRGRARRTPCNNPFYDEILLSE